MGEQTGQVNPLNDSQVPKLRCSFAWENRTEYHNASAHQCDQSGNHTYHRCKKCEMLRRNPRGDCVSPVDLHARLLLEAERWINECQEGFVWTTKDVVDFAEIVFQRIADAGGWR